jgi:hypothetical protein
VVSEADLFCLLAPVSGFGVGVAPGAFDVPVPNVLGDDELEPPLPPAVSPPCTIAGSPFGIELPLSLLHAVENSANTNNIGIIIFFIELLLSSLKITVPF